MLLSLKASYAHLHFLPFFIYIPFFPFSFIPFLFKKEKFPLRTLNYFSSYRFFLRGIAVIVIIIIVAVAVVVTAISSCHFLYCHVFFLLFFLFIPMSTELSFFLVLYIFYLNVLFFPFNTAARRGLSRGS